MVDFLLISILLLNFLIKLLDNKTLCNLIINLRIEDNQCIFLALEYLEIAT